MTPDVSRSAKSAVSAAPSVVSSVAPLPYRQADLPVEQRVQDLVSRMTLEEKIDQLHQGNVGDTNPNNLAARADHFRPTYGSYIIGGPSVFEVRNAIQRRALSESRLVIPVIFGADVIHGWRVITPIPLAQACTWNPSLVERGAAMAAEEARAQGVDWTFAPMLDHCVDARWGRIAETFGESPHASSVFAAASVRGFQGGALGGPGSLAACLKHYVGYGASEGGREIRGSVHEFDMRAASSRCVPRQLRGSRRAVVRNGRISTALSGGRTDNDQIKTNVRVNTVAAEYGYSMVSKSPSLARGTPAIDRMRST